MVWFAGYPHVCCLTLSNTTDLSSQGSCYWHARALRRAQWKAMGNDHGGKNCQTQPMDIQIDVLWINRSIVLWKFPGILKLYSHETPTFTAMFTSMCTSCLSMLKQLFCIFYTMFYPLLTPLPKKISRATKIQHHPRSCMRQLLDFYNFATDHTASRPDFWSRFLNPTNDFWKTMKTHRSMRSCAYVSKSVPCFLL